MKIDLTYADPKSKHEIEKIIKEKLGLPKNYPSRLAGQIKRQSESKTLEELKEYLINDWREYICRIEELFSGLGALQQELTGYFFENQEKLQQFKFDMEYEVSQIQATHNNAFKTSYNEYKKSLIAEYIEMGISPDKAADMFMQYDMESSQLDMEGLFKKALTDWHC